MAALAATVLTLMRWRPVRASAIVAVLLSMVLAGCAERDAVRTPEPACFLSYDASYEPATPSPDPAASC